MTYIQIVLNGDDSGRIAQHAPDKQTAQKLIDSGIMPKLLPGYNYKICTN